MDENQNILPAIEALIQQGSINTEKLQELGLLNDNQIQMLNKLIETGVETNQILDMVLQLAKEISKNKEVEISKINGIETITLKGEKGDTQKKVKITLPMKTLLKSKMVSKMK